MAPKLRKSIQKEKIPLIFVPGIKGSKLFDRKGEIRWLTGWQALGFSTPDLRLNSDSGKDNNSNDLVPIGPVDRVTAIPYIVDASIYDGWLRRILNENQYDFYVFSYDWRKNNLETRKQLQRFLIEVSSAYSQKPILIGHSMGGMLSFSVVNENPDLVSRVVYVGVPFRGGIGYMRDLHEGTPTGLNSTIQSPCRVARYESVYGFFPRLNTWDTKDVTLDTKGSPITVDFFQAESWKEQNFGFHSHTCQPDEIPNPLEFQRILDNAKKFRASLDPSKKLKQFSPPSLVVSAQNRPTLRAIQMTQDSTGSGSLKKWELDLAPKVSGDGRVSHENSLPPKGFPYKLIFTEYEHSVMLNDAKLQDEILDFLQASLSAGEQN